MEVGELFCGNPYLQCIIKVILGTVSCLSMRLIQAANHRDLSIFAIPDLLLLVELLQAVDVFNFENQVSIFVVLQRSKKVIRKASKSALKK